MLYHLNQSAVGFGHFFNLKIASEAFGPKNRKVIMVPQFCSEDKSYWCRFEKKEKSHKGAGLEKSHNGVDFSKYGFGEKSSWCN